MGTEVEIKLTLAQDKVEKFLKTNFLQQYQGSHERVFLENCYFDTPCLALKQQAIALRIRRSGDRYIQTLKTKGSSVNGMHRRSEWEWELEKNQLDTSLLPPEHWPSEIDTSELTPLFNTNFSRDLWYVDSVDSDGRPFCVEIALDRGEITAPSEMKRVAICEVELELQSGGTEALLQLTKQLCDEVPELSPSNESKAQRGFALIQ